MIFLEGLYSNEKERATNSFNKFDENNNHQYVLEIDKKVVGFVNVGTTDEKEYKDCGELHAIYVISEFKGNGYGKKLFEYITKFLYNNSHRNGCLLW